MNPAPSPLHPRLDPDLHSHLDPDPLDFDPLDDDHLARYLDHDSRGDHRMPDSTQRFDPIALVFGLVFLGFAGLALDGRPLDVSASFVVPAALAGLAVWLVVDAITGRRDGAA